jgi:hypothetical protein
LSVLMRSPAELPKVLGDKGNKSQMSRTLHFNGETALMFGAHAVDTPGQDFASLAHQPPKFFVGLVVGLKLGNAIYAYSANSAKSSTWWHVSISLLYLCLCLDLCLYRDHPCRVQAGRRHRHRRP